MKINVNPGFTGFTFQWVKLLAKYLYYQEYNYKLIDIIKRREYGSTKHTNDRLTGFKSIGRLP